MLIMSMHVLVNLQVPWNSTNRAYHTIPSYLELKTSKIPNAGLGIFSKADIAPFTWLGKYEGVLHDPENCCDNSGYIFEVIEVISFYGFLL